MTQPPWRRFVKTRPTTDELRAERVQQLSDRIRQQRQARAVDRRNVLPPPFEEFYVIHCHAAARPDDAFQLPFGFNMIFYCADGATTQEAARADPLADWPILLRRLKAGASVPAEHVDETIAAWEPCRDYRCTSDADSPDAGVYYVRRSHEGLTPIRVKRIAPFSAGPVRLSFVLDNIIRPDAELKDAKRIGLPGVINVHWVACRAIE